MRASGDGLTAGRGDRIAPFALPAFRSGKQIEYRPGRVTVLSFCALWCVTWKEQAARLQRARQMLAGLPIDYLTISVDGRWAEQYSSAGSADPEMQSNRGAVGDGKSTVLLDIGGRVSARLGVRAVPFVIVVDSQGIARYAHQGIIRADELVDTLRGIATGNREGKNSASERSVYLTFDDFPSFDVNAPSRPSDDEALLDILRAADIRATFFCIGAHLGSAAARAVAIRAAREGHAIQIHSWDHDGTDPQIERCRRTIIALARDITSPTLYRPPGRSDLYRLDGSLALPIRYVVNPFDFARPGVAELSRRVLQSVRPGSIIQLHSGVEQTRMALPGMIDSLRRQGMSFETQR